MSAPRRLRTFASSSTRGAARAGAARHGHTLAAALSAALRLACLAAAAAAPFPPTPFHGGVLANLSASSGAGSAACTWALSPSGRYSNAQSGLCLTVLGAGGRRGSAVYLAPCGAANVTAHGEQSWTWVGAEMDGAIMFTGESGDEECVTGVDPASAPPSELVLAPCAFLAWQQVTSDADGNGTLSLQNLPAGAPTLFVCSPS